MKDKKILIGNRVALIDGVHDRSCQRRDTDRHAEHQHFIDIRFPGTLRVPRKNGETGYSNILVR
jgi:hypothetical protein